MDYLQKPYICVEGVIGAGKTSLCQHLAESENCHLILEEFDENPFLKAFYEKPHRYAFPLELFFMNERINQLTEAFSGSNMFIDYYLADYSFPKTSIFAQENLSPAESKLFKSLFNQLSDKIPQPSLLVYMARPVEVLMKHIKKRGRSYEENISPDYLRDLDHLYRQYLDTITQYDIIIYQLEDIDIHNESFLKHLKAQIHSTEREQQQVIKPEEIS